jgi:integrase
VGGGRAGVHTDPAARPLSESGLRSALRRATTTAGMRHVHPHVLRHTAASLALAHGATVHEVADMLEHVNALMVATVYGHALPGGRDRAEAGVAAALGWW